MLENNYFINNPVTKEDDSGNFGYIFYLDEEYFLWNYVFGFNDSSSDKKYDFFK